MAGIADVAKFAKLKDEEVKAVFNALAIQAVQESVIIKGFGTFKTVTRAARNGINPKTQEPLTIPAKTVLTFKAAKKK